MISASINGLTVLYAHVFKLHQIINPLKILTLTIKKFLVLETKIVSVELLCSGVGRSIIGGGAIFIYSCSALLTSFEIDCF